MPVGLYFVMKYFSFTSTIHLTATLVYNDAVCLDPSMTL